MDVKVQVDRSRDRSQPLDKLGPDETLKANSDQLRGTIAKSLADPITLSVDPSDNKLMKFHGIYQQDDRDIRDERRRQKLEPAFSFMARVRLPGGVCSPSQWLKLDELGRAYGGNTVRLTTRQTFQLHHVLKHNLRPALQGLREVLLDTKAACGDDSRGEFYSIAVSNGYQQVDSGTKMIHLGKNTSSRIISKGIAAGFSQNTYRGQVSAHRKAANARNFTNCDSLLIGDKCGAHTVPYIEVKNNSSRVEHEATTSKVDDDQLFYCRSRGMDEEAAVALVVNGFCREVLQALPMEFAMEAQSLVAISLEGSVG